MSRWIIVVAAFAATLLPGVAAGQNNCPLWKDIAEYDVTCPNLRKTVTDHIFWWDGHRTNNPSGSGLCAGSLQCWPVFNTPVIIEDGSDDTYNYRIWFRNITNMTVYYEGQGAQYCAPVSSSTYRSPLDYEHTGVGNTGNAGLCRIQVRPSDFSDEE